MIAIVVPVLGRPHRAAPLVESITEAATVPTEVVFVCSPHDAKQISACLETGARTIVAPFDLAGGDYARKVNHGVTQTDAPWLFQAGDDLRFHRGWDTEALAMAHGKPEAVLIGTNDMGNPVVKSGIHSTHSLMSRAYVELGSVDEPGKPLHEGYWHCWVDNELIETAKSRRAYWSARRSMVEHLHHIWREPGSRQRKSEDDATYRRGQERYRQDQLLFEDRRPLWRGRR